jgi:hypothetical protein
LSDLILNAFVLHDASFRLVVDPANKTVTAPQFYGATVEELLWPNYCILIVRTKERAGRYKVVVIAERVCALLLHCRTYCGPLTMVCPASDITAQFAELSAYFAPSGTEPPRPFANYE